MTQAGWKWFCTKCSYEYYGEEQPEECSECESLGEDFYKTPD